jgi:pyruvate dehydrogenase E1 component alpha subunit
MKLPSKKVTLDLYHRMILIRRFEEAIARIYREGRIPGFVHLYIGEEAVAAGVTAHLKEDDWIGSTHRGHAHALVKGVPLTELMAELFGRTTGCSGGRGGSMHLYSVKHGLLGTNGIVGYGLPQAVGAAFTAKYLGTTQVGVAFFGDGAANIGVFHETLNMASIWKLPAVFVCENNLYATELPFSQATAGQSVAARAAAYDMPGVEVDGQDVMAVYDAAGKAINRAREGKGPSLIECRTYRFVGHHEGDPGTGYRTKEEIEEWKKRDPIHLFTKRVLEERKVSQDELDEIEKDIAKSIEEAIEYAESSPWPSADDVETKIFIR